MNGRMMGTILALLVLALSLPALAGAEDTLYVKKVENLPEDFIFGMDISSVLAEEASGVKYYDFEGNEADLFRILADNGINYIRVRIWNDPFDEEGRGFGGGNCDIAAAVEIGKRATACGMKLLVDFHYSDFWADPGKQMVPRAWKDMDAEEKEEALHAYTLDCMRQLKDAGVDVGMVQLGNETNGMLCGEKIWSDIAHLMDAGAKAVREVYPEALIAVHFANPESPDNYRKYAEKLAYYEQYGRIGYDVFATSYYPYWHGTLDNLASILTEISEKYGKKVMVMETSYAYTAEDTDFSGNTIGEGGEVSGITRTHSRDRPTVSGTLRTRWSTVRLRVSVSATGKAPGSPWERKTGKRITKSGRNTAPAGPPAMPRFMIPMTRGSTTAAAP